MDKFKKREGFFNLSKYTFGSDSLITAYFQNEGCINKQQDVEDICDLTEKFIKQKEFELETLRKNVKAFQNQLINQCIKGDVY